MAKMQANTVNSSTKKSFRIDDLLSRKSSTNTKTSVVPLVQQHESRTSNGTEGTVDRWESASNGNSSRNNHFHHQHHHNHNHPRDLTKVEDVKTNEHQSLHAVRNPGWTVVHRSIEPETQIKVPIPQNLPPTVSIFSGEQLVHPFDSYRESLVQRYNELLTGPFPLSYYNTQGILAGGGVGSVYTRRVGYPQPPSPEDFAQPPRPAPHPFAQPIHGLYAASLAYLASDSTPYSMSSLYHNGNKRKGGQIRFTNFQTSQLEKSFMEHKYLNANDRKKLASSLGLSDRQVKTWFQNRRAKWRKTSENNLVDVEGEVTRSSPIDQHLYSPDPDYEKSPATSSDNGDQSS